MIIISICGKMLYEVLIIFLSYRTAEVSKCC